MSGSGRHFHLIAGGVTALLTAGFAAPRAAAESPNAAFATLIEQARQLANQPYVAPEEELPPSVASLDYDGARDIRCLPENFLWYGTDAPYRVQFRHRGWLFKEKVRLGTVDPDTLATTDLPFSTERFTYGPIANQEINPAQLPADLGYAGIALHKVGYEKQPDGHEQETFNEFLSIQGGSYFRAIGFGQHWGSSVRAVAINTGLDQPEEFPRWVELWAERPAADAHAFRLYGMIDGPSVTGAYQLTIRPDQTTAVDVRARLFFRQPVHKLGLAPITSMYLFGEEEPARFGDYRAEVHDADGLVVVHPDGPVDWRPLRNPPRLTVSRFRVTDPAGFGLLQRDRDFEHYADLETEMQIRPSIYVQPDGPWGDGAIELLEIASDDEGIDNIGAYWVPDDESWNHSGGELALGYRVEFTQEPRPADSKLIRFASTRRVIEDGSNKDTAGSVVRTAAGEGASTQRPVGRLLLDTANDTALAGGTIVRADVTVNRGQLVGKPVIQYNKFTHGYRLFFDVQADGGEPVELRATLRDADGQPLSETWLYRWDLP